MAPVISLIGKWKGGITGNMMTIAQLNDGKLECTTTGSKGGRAGFYGACLKLGGECRGYWFDVDSGTTEGNRLACTMVVAVDLTADPTGNTAVCKFKTKDGGSGEWTAKRYSDLKDLKRTDGKIVDFVFKSKKTFESLTADPWAARNSKMEKELAEIMASTEARPWFDGTGGAGYVPGPGVGSMYMTQYDLEKHLHQMEVEHEKAMHEAYEAEVVRLGVKIEKGEGNVEVMKKRKEVIEKFLKGDAGKEKLKERKAFKPGNTKVKPASEYREDRKPEPFMGAAELRRALRIMDEEYNAKSGERLNAEIARLEAVIAKGGDGVDKAQSRIEMCKKLVKGVKGAEKLKERPAMKPPSFEVHRKSDEAPPENMPPDAYYSEWDLERKLAHDMEAAPQRWATELEAEIGRLQVSIAKGGDGAEKAKTRLEMATKLLKGAKGAEKLKERKKFKLNPSQNNAKLSGTVMLHPCNVQAMLRSMK